MSRIRAAGYYRRDRRSGQEALALVGLIAAVASMWETTQSLVIRILIVAVGLLLGAVAIWAIGSERRRARQRADSVARVRRAEQNLERVLRPASAVTISYGSGEVVVDGSEDVRELVEQLQGLLAQGSHQGPSGPVEEGVEPSKDDAEPLAVSDADRARLTLSELWVVTHARLDHYHGIALGQAQKSFRNAQVSMALGFVLLIVFVVVALQASTTAGSVVAGGLGAVSAALSGYVSRTFVRSQESAAGHLRAYFDQPLEFSRYLAAERLVADSNLGDEQRAEVVTALAQAMIAGPVAPLVPDVSAPLRGNGPQG